MVGAGAEAGAEVEVEVEALGAEGGSRSRWGWWSCRHCEAVEEAWLVVCWVCWWVCLGYGTSSSRCRT